MAPFWWVISGDGQVNAFNARSGRYLGALRQSNGQPIVLEGLWDLEPGTATNGGENSVWFAAGIDKAQHGLLGVLRPSDAGPLPGAEVGVGTVGHTVGVGDAQTVGEHCADVVSGRQLRLLSCPEG